MVKARRKMEASEDGRGDIGGVREQRGGPHEAVAQHHLVHRWQSGEMKYIYRVIRNHNSISSPNFDMKKRFW